MVIFNSKLLNYQRVFPKFRPVSGSLMEPEAGVEEPPLIQATPELELAAVEDDSSDEAPWPPWDVATCGDFKRKFLMMFFMAFLLARQGMWIIYIYCIYIYILIRQVFVIDNFAYLRLNHDFQCTKIADLGYFW